MRWVLAVAFAAACGGRPATTTTTPAAPPSPPPTATPTTSGIATAIAPVLFTASQLRDGNPQGRVIEFQRDTDGTVQTEHWEFTHVDDRTATIHAITRDADGKVLDDATGTSTWDELAVHGQFPAASTTITDNVEITVPAGTFVTRLYEVTANDTIRRFWFAVDLPGPPVQYTTERGGKTVMRTQMLRAR